MKDFVSTHWISVLAFASMSIVCAALVHYGFPWTGVAVASVAMSAAVVVALRPGPSISQLIHEVETEPRKLGSKGKVTP